MYDWIPLFIIGTLSTLAAWLAAWLLWISVIRDIYYDNYSYDRPSRLANSIVVNISNLKARCVYCHDDTWEFACQCGATYHRDCWNELETCASLGCSRTKALTDEAIRKRAYNLWLLNGQRPNTDQDYWLEAERLELS